jgi:hypothetical protein
VLLSLCLSKKKACLGNLSSCMSKRQQHDDCSH